MKRLFSILALTAFLGGLYGLVLEAHAQATKGDVQFIFNNFSKDQQPEGMLSYEGLTVYTNDYGIITAQQLTNFKTKPLNFTLNIETPTQNLNCTTIDNYDVNHTYRVTATYNPQTQTVSCVLSQQA